MDTDKLQTETNANKVDGHRQMSDTNKLKIKSMNTDTSQTETNCEYRI